MVPTKGSLSLAEKVRQSGKEMLMQADYTAWAGSVVDVKQGEEARAPEV